MQSPFLFLIPCLVSLVAAKGETIYQVDPDTGITLPEGFDAEMLYEVPPSQGSWVAMAFDPKGRLIVSDQDDKGVFRVTLPGNGVTETKVESLPGFPTNPSIGDGARSAAHWVSTTPSTAST